MELDWQYKLFHTFSFNSASLMGRFERLGGAGELLEEFESAIGLQWACCASLMVFRGGLRLLKVLHWHLCS